MSKLISLFALSFFFAYPAPSTASPYGFYASSSRLFFESSSYNSNANYDQNGNVVPLTQSNKFSELRFKLGGAYDFNQWLGVSADFGFGRTDSITNTLERYNGGVTEGTLGVDALLWAPGGFKFVTSGSFLVPFYGAPDLPSLNGNQVLLGDGAMVGTAKLSVARRGRSFGAWAYVGYSYLTNGLSPNLPYGLVANGYWRKLTFEVSINGISSNSGDQYTSNPSQRQQLTNQVDGGSFYYYAVNPGYLNVDGSIAWRFLQNYSASLGIEQSLSGTNYAQGTRFLFTVSYAFYPQHTTSFSPASPAVRGAPLTPPPTDDKGFDVDTKGEDPTPAK